MARAQAEAIFDPPGTERFYCFCFSFALGQPGGQIDDQHQHQQHGTDGPGGGKVAVLKGTQVQQHRQGGTVGGVGLDHTLGDHFRRTGGEQQRGALAYDAAYGQNAAGDDAVDAAGQHDGADDVPLASPQAQRTLAVALGHRFQGFLGGADDGGQVHDHQRQAAGQQAGLEAQRLAEHQHAHQTVEDAGDAGQRLVGELDHLDQTAVGGVFGQVDRCAHTQAAVR